MDGTELDKKKEYAKAYYEKNKERIKENRRNRWKNATAEQREKQRKSSREFYHRNATKNKERAVAWMREHRELTNARARLSRYKKQGNQQRVLKELEFIEQLKAKNK